MPTAPRSRARFALIAAGALSWNNIAAPRLGLSARDRALANAAVAVAAVRPREFPRWRSGVRWGLGASAPVALGYSLVAAVPSLRARVGALAPEEDAAQWLLLRIPLGTVVCEELIFRSALHEASVDAFGVRGGIAASSIVFGLWHIPVARGTGVLGPVPTLVATGLGGALFAWLRHRSGSVVAPALLHYALNAGGAGLRVLAARSSSAVAAP